MKIEDLKPLYASDRKEDYGNIRRIGQQEVPFTGFEKAASQIPTLPIQRYRGSRHQETIYIFISLRTLIKILFNLHYRLSLESNYAMILVRYVPNIERYICKKFVCKALE